MGALWQIEMVTDSSYETWFLEWVVVTDLKTRVVYRFPCRCWISVYHGQIRRIYLNNADNLGLTLHVSSGYRNYHRHIIIILFAQTEQLAVQ